MTSEKSNRKRLFCRYFASLGSLSEAARRSGLSESDALETSQSRGFEQSTERFARVPSAELVLAGLERLAFGAANDAVRLVFSQGLTDEELARLDIFNISEISRDKNGGVEIRLFDRQKALERLWEYSAGRAERDAAERLLNALRGGEDSETG